MAEVVTVATAAEMEQAVMQRSARADVVVMAAAVADFRPRRAASDKLAKVDGVPEIALEPTSDILASLGRSRRPGQVLVGFAAETADVAERARAKLMAKNLDLVVGNDVTAPDAGFDSDTNRAVIVDATTTTDVPLVAKRKLASILLDAVFAHLNRPAPTSTDLDNPTRDVPQLNGRRPDDPTGPRAATRRSTS